MYAKSFQIARPEVSNNDQQGQVQVSRDRRVLLLILLLTLHFSQTNHVSDLFSIYALPEVLSHSTM